MVDPVIGAAAIGLISTWGGKVLDRLLEDGEERAVAVDARGELHAFTPVQTTPTTVSLAFAVVVRGLRLPAGDGVRDAVRAGGYAGGGVA